MRLAVLTSHPIQYYAPLFRKLARRIDLTVYYAHRATPQQQANAGFGVSFDWDVDMLSGYEHEFLRNVAREPAVDHFNGCDTPEIDERLAHGGFDALLVTGWNLKCFWQGVWAAKRRGLPAVARGDSHLETPRGFVKRAAKRAAYPSLLRMFDGAAYVGLRNLDYWRHYNYPRDRLFFSPHCVDNDFFAARATSQARNALRHRLGIPASSHVVTFVGRLMPFKRPDDVLSAVAHMQRHGANPHVLFVGSGELLEPLRQRAMTDGIVAHFLGFQNQSALPTAYAAGDVLVLPSDERETWGLVANEALACGVPIVVSDACGCAPDLAGDNLAGRVFPVGNIEALAGAIRSTTTQRPTREALAKKAGLYSPGSAAEGVEIALRALVERRRRHA